MSTNESKPNAGQMPGADIRPSWADQCYVSVLPDGEVRIVVGTLTGTGEDRMDTAFVMPQRVALNLSEIIRRCVGAWQEHQAAARAEAEKVNGGQADGKVWRQ